MILGLIVVLGTSNAWVIAWLISLRFGLDFYKSKFRLPNAMIAVLLSLIIPTILSADYSYALVWTGVILTLYAAKDSLKYNNHYWIPITVIIVAHTIYASINYLDGIDRVYGFTSNSSILGMAGMSMLPVGSVIAGMSLSRTTLIGVAILAAFTPQKKIIFAGILTLVLAFSIGFVKTPERFGFDVVRTNNPEINNRTSIDTSDVKRSIDNRLKTIDGTSTENVPDRFGEPQTVKWRWHGYGLGNYTIETGRALPHNIFALVWYELGIFSIPFTLSLLWLWFSHSRSFRLLTVICTVGMLNHEFLGRIEGIYMILGLHTFTTLWPGQFWLWHAMIKGVGKLASEGRKKCSN